MVFVVVPSVIVIVADSAAAFAATVTVTTPLLYAAVTPDSLAELVAVTLPAGRLTVIVPVSPFAIVNDAGETVILKSGAYTVENQPS